MKLILIIGMHRCGTSLLSSYIESLGYYIGDNKNTDKDWQNPNRYWENDSFTDFHEKLLKYNNLEWYNVNISNLNYTLEHVEEYFELIKKEFKNKERILIKDPRLSFFNNFLNDVIKKLDCETKIIFSTRNKQECCVSLNKAQKIDYKIGEILYENSHKCYTKKMLKISYNDFINDNQRIRKNICNFLNEKDSNFHNVDKKLYRNKF